MAITIRDAKKDDWKKICNLLHGVGFDHLQDGVVYEWQFSGSSGNKIVKVAHDDRSGEIIGHYALIPMDFVCPFGKFTGGKLEGSAIDHGYRGKNLLKLYPEMTDRRLFKELIVSMILEIKRSNIDIVFGFPNDGAKKAQIEAGFIDTTREFDYFTKIVNMDKFVKHRFGKKNSVIQRCLVFLLRLYGGLRRVQMANVGYRMDNYDPEKHDIEELMDSMSNSKRMLSINRDDRYLQWRYLSNPVYRNFIRLAINEKNEACGMVAYGYRCDGELIEAKIYDIIYKDNDQTLVNFLIAKASEELSNSGVDIIKSFLLGDNYRELKRAYLSDGFFHKKNKKNCFIYLSDRVKDMDIQFLDISNWYINYSFNQF